MINLLETLTPSTAIHVAAEMLDLSHEHQRLKKLHDQLDNRLYCPELFWELELRLLNEFYENRERFRQAKAHWFPQTQRAYAYDRVR